MKPSEIQSYCSAHPASKRSFQVTATVRALNYIDDMPPWGPLSMEQQRSSDNKAVSNT